MKIGTQLKNTRLLLGLTQEQFSAGIVTESYYSRVESNKNNISMDSLLKILNYNYVSLYDFFEPILKTDIDYEIILTFINHDIKKIKSFDTLNNDGQTLAKLLQAILKRENLDDFRKFKSQVTKYVNKSAKDETCIVFASFILAYLCDLNELNSLINKITAYASTDNGLILRILAHIELVALERFYKAQELEDVKKMANLIQELPNDSVLVLEKVVAKYYLALLDKHIEDANEISKVLKITGYDEYLP
uniref:helix-turn-helix domain-containing protein n=1 Tax=Lactobacillus taiwanensis TaxID=508451 RepID=UPI00255822C0|nr:helix-turn-helix transcriptional regulator [Lactobacillus taiwanensis]